MVSLEIKDLGVVNKFLGLRIILDDKCGYMLDQEVMIDVLLKDHGLESANSVRVPINDDCNEVDPESKNIYWLRQLKSDMRVSRHSSHSSGVCFGLRAAHDRTSALRYIARHGRHTNQV